MNDNQVDLSKPFHDVECDCGTLYIDNFYTTCPSCGKLNNDK